jgi:hypothetical protein
VLRATGESMMDETPRIDRPENRSREAVKGKERSLRSASTHSQTPNYPDTTLTIIWFRHDNVGDRENDGSEHDMWRYRHLPLRIKGRGTA